MPVDVVDTADVQGDILFDGFPKFAETFWFFRIKDAPQFCKNLADTANSFSSCTQVQANRDIIEALKQAGNLVKVPLSHANIAFSKTGLDKIALAVKDLNLPLLQTSDSLFSKGMEADTTLSDPKWDTAFQNRPFHGVVLVAGDSRSSVASTLSTITTGLTKNSAAEVATSVDGDVRPGDMKGHEHFDFLDGISEPAVKGVNDAGALAQDIITKDVFLVTNNSPSGPNNTTTDGRPLWMENGSFMVFRKLAQNVKDWREAVSKEADARGITPALMGAKLMGRWPSGCPLMMSSTADNSEFANKNDFDFVSNTMSNNDDAVCPRGAHIRKTNPRAGPGDNIHRIIRRGIPYGPEFDAIPNAERGLLFVCYQNKIDQGYQFIQRSWANNVSFPFGSPAGISPGLDPVIGQNGKKDKVMMTITPNSLTRTPKFDGFSGINQFVTPKGGEYFFVPPMKALKPGGALVTLR